jgi:AAA domain
MSRLRIRGVPAIAEELARGPEPRWLIRGLWPAGSYGIVASPPKAGKSWLAYDLAVSVASASPFLGSLPIDDPGGVLFLAGEDGERSALRRLAAIVSARGGSIEADLAAVRLCTTPILLAREADLAELRAELEQDPPTLVVLDPLYVAAAGAKGGDLYAMGEVLRTLQELAQGVGASLFVTHHVRKGTDAASGIDAVWGAGPGAWGRIVAVGTVEHSDTDQQGRSTVTLSWSFSGSEIPDQKVRLRRRVWSEDPESLAAPLHYQVDVLASEPTKAEPPTKELSWPERRVLDVLGGGDRLSIRKIGDALAADSVGIPLRRPTIETALEALAGRGLADGGNGVWWALNGQAPLAEVP